MVPTGLKAFPLKEAYPFAEQHGFADEARKIRELDVTWDRPYNSTVRRGFMVALLEGHGLLGSFKEKHWPFGLTPKGEAECRHCLRVKKEFEAFCEGLPRAGAQRTSAIEKNLVQNVTADELATWRRQLLRLLDALDNRREQRSGLAARITRLRNEGRIPGDTAAQMRLVSEARNAAEYENRLQTASGAQAVRNAWAAIGEWADSNGLSWRRD